MDLKKHDGFSLVEVILAAGMMGGLALGYSQIVANTSTQISRLQKGVQAKEFTSEISALLADPVSCSRSLEGKNPKNDDSITKLIRVFSNDTERDRYVVGTKYGSPPIEIVGYQLSDGHDEVEIIELEKSGTTFLTVKYNVGKAGSSAGSDIKSQRVKVSVVLDDDLKISSCATASSGLAPIGNSSDGGTGAGAVVLGYGKQSFNGVPEHPTVKGMYCTKISFSPWANGKISAIGTLNYDTAIAAHAVGNWGVHVSGINGDAGEADLCIDSRHMSSPSGVGGDYYWSGNLVTERVFWIVYGQ